MADVEIYTNKSNEQPFYTFLEELKKAGDFESVLKIDSYVNLLKVLGNDICKNSNWAKHLKDDLYELRPKNKRILYFSYVNGKYVILHGFIKKTNKTPSEEIERAMREIEDYKRRK